MGEHILTQLRESNLPIVREVRGLGLMIGIELKQKVTPILRELQKRRLLALPAGKTILRLLPPLVISHKDCNQISAIVTKVLRESQSI